VSIDDQMVRGVNYIFTRQYILQHQGMDLWKKVLAMLPLEHRQEWEKPLLAISLYSFSAYMELIEKYCDMISVAQKQELISIYEYIAEQSLTTLYKHYMNRTDPSSMIGNFPKMWDRFFSAGKVEVYELTPTSVRLEFELPEVFLSWIFSACLGFSRKAVELGGGVGLVQQEKKRIRVKADIWKISYSLNWGK